ncbi:TIGR03085 family metal-binding protein [Jidongwangia harbinensis]|uniref:TIGR03085 family metal-binding protein n=1 Tax=Jidongwangia harbinensis TaxID=2878561 RepID=UPI001CD94011|nr:TIGR03085 family metal-binding protein [Jidongwangia harbinensis]MCA2212351.1 TIGR03085 family protein [Jidongwangia harbinensis]
MTDFARRDRRELADLLLATGPDAPTLCEGWTTRDLAAHLVVRERRPDAMVGMVIPPLRGRGEQLRRARTAEPFEQLVAEIRRPPWWSPLGNPLTDELVNSGEMFIHREDIRRGTPGWEPRELDAGQQRLLWRGVRFTARIGLRRLHLPLLVRAPGVGELAIGGDDPRATLTGDPGELTMFVSGRQRAARVTIDGEPDAVERLRTARLGI